MTKHLRTVKASIVMSILLFSVFAIIIPTSSAGPLGLTNCNATLVLEELNPEDYEPIVPLQGPMKFPIKVGYLVTGIFAEQTVNRLQSMNVPATISLSVEETPSWITASISPNIVTPAIKQGYTYQNATLSISFSKNAPAKTEVKIKVKMEADPVSAILLKVNGAVAYGEVVFTPEFLPVIDATPKENYKEISPGDLAEFEIDLENMGNAETEFIFEVIEKPEDWSASIVAATKVGSAVEGNNPKKTVKLLVQPPYGFGYHDERVDIKVRVYGQYWASTSGNLLTSSTYDLTFTIRSRGFSTPGFEAMFVFIALIGVVAIYKKREKIIK